MLIHFCVMTYTFTTLSRALKHFAKEKFMETFFSGALEGVMIPKKAKNIAVRTFLSH